MKKNRNSEPSSTEARKRFGPVVPVPLIIENITRLTGGVELQEEEMIRLSPIPIPPEPAAQADIFFRTVYPGCAQINVVTDHRKTERDGEIICSPRGPGVTRTAAQWAEHCKTQGVPSDDAGAWFRPNAVSGLGSGFAGTVTDEDIASLGYLLVESDIVTMPKQLSVLARLELPIVSIVTSGGSSAHALVNIRAANPDDYDAAAYSLFGCLRVFGIDTVNSNPSRLSRLPGAVRKIGGTGDGRQRLLYLNPNASNETIIR